MSDVRNAGAPFADYEKLLQPDRDQMVQQLKALTSSGDFCVVEGNLRLRVPLDLALAHVSPDVMQTAVLAIGEYARLILRVVATQDGAAFQDWWRSQEVTDLPGQVLELGPNWSIFGDPRASVGDDVADDLVADDASSAGVLGGEPVRQDHDDPAHAVKESSLLAGQSDSLNHPDPLVPRRSTPPP